MEGNKVPLYGSGAGLNAPIPLGASFGYHPGGWGKPPVDEFGRPLYGDVFGLQQQEQMNYEEEPVDRSKHWGDLECSAEEVVPRSNVFKIQNAHLLNACRRRLEKTSN